MKAKKLFVILVGGFLLLIFLAYGAGKTKGCFPAQDLPPFQVPTANPAEVSFIAFGDAGESNKFQRDNFTAAKEICLNQGCDFGLMLGDNFYPRGIKKATPTTLGLTYQNLFAELALPFYAVLGNHDAKNSIFAQIDLNQFEPLWNMPAPRYSFTAGPALFVGLNSNCQGFDFFWAKEIFAASKKTWKVLFQHHTIYSTGSHGDAPKPIGLLWQRLQPKDLNLFLSGHDHHLEYLTKRGQKAQYVVSGSVSRLRKTEERPSLAKSQYRKATFGFAWVKITKGSMEVQLFNSNAKKLYQTIKTQEE